MKITVIGTGYVGLVAGACFADIGNEVWCVDVDQTKIDKLKQGIIPIYEKGLEPIVNKNFQEGRLHFSTNLLDGFDQSQFIFIAVGTPSNPDGSVDLKYVYAVAEEIAKNLKDYKLIINKSTVPVGTGKQLRDFIDQKIKERGINVDFDIVSNPEFLREGNAIEDFMNPDRVIIGTESIRAKEQMNELYSGLFKDAEPRIIFMDVRSAEVTKYASNSMLATKISFINEISNLCEKVDANVEMVRLGVGADKRIGYSFISPGIGYGGSCFPKDVKAIINTGNEYGYDMKLLKAVELINETQKAHLFDKIQNYFDNKKDGLKGKTIAIWGLAFKPETDDMRESPSQVIIRKLVEGGTKIKAHDPEAQNEAKRLFKDIETSIEYFDDNYECLKDCDALALLTEWNIYKQPNFQLIKKHLKNPIIFDGRNQYRPSEMKEMGFDYFSIGR
ncbi:MAG: UDP-glucose/GDP-mannose dehydrogenase family protein [Candidatus Shapirobacteria bacterium]|nr:UDP-glucose/GDP-mannose dehydrogenase family protein [Candidatus Shapirobacteria bacterium]